MLNKLYEQDKDLHVANYVPMARPLTTSCMPTKVIRRP